jgi:ketosteroid isomerase-like protein
MSQETTKIVRHAIAVRTDTRRGLEQEFYVRLPDVAAALFRVLWRVVGSLPPRSRLRRAVIRNLARRACEALNRRDLELFSVFVDPEIESVNTPKVVALGGLVPASHGREAWIANQRSWLEDWEEFRYEPHEILDLGGDCLLLIGRVKGAGRGSGVVVDSEWALLATVSNGRLSREQNFLDRGEAFEAAGLQE